MKESSLLTTAKGLYEECCWDPCPRSQLQTFLLQSCLRYILLMNTYCCLQFMDFWAQRSRIGRPRALE